MKRNLKNKIVIFVNNNFILPSYLTVQFKYKFMCVANFFIWQQSFGINLFSINYLNCVEKNLERLIENIY